LIEVEKIFNEKKEWTLLISALSHDER